MIYIYKNGKFKGAKYKTSEHIIKALEIDDFDSKKAFDKLNEKGTDLYCMHVPKMDSDDPERIMWSTDKEELESLFWLMCEEI